MSVQRNHHGPELKARVAIEAIKEQKTVNELASEYRLHPGMISRWKKQLLDNVKRLWRSVKYEDVYLKDYQASVDTRIGLSHYFYFYNDERPHQSLDYRTPEDVHFQENCLVVG